MAVEQREQTWPAAGPALREAALQSNARRWLGLLRSPILQTAVVVTLTVFVAMVAAVTLTLANFNRALSETVESRFEFLALSIRDDIETGLNLGLGLSQLTNVQDIIDDRLARDDSVLRIVVLDTDGERLFATRRDGVADSPDDAARVGAPLVNTFGQTVGTVQVVYTTGSYQATVQRVGEALARNTGLLTAIAGLVAGLGCAALLRSIPRSLERIRAWCLSGDVGEPPHNDIERTAAEAVDTSRQVLEDLDALSRELPKARAEGRG